MYYYVSYFWLDWKSQTVFPWSISSITSREHLGLKSSKGSIRPTSKILDSDGWKLILAVGWGINWSCYLEFLPMPSTCGLSFTVPWLHSKSIYPKSPKVEGAIPLRSRRKNWHSINPSIFYCQQRPRAHQDSRKGTQTPLFHGEVSKNLWTPLIGHT